MADRLGVIRRLLALGLLAAGGLLVVALGTGRLGAALDRGRLADEEWARALATTDSEIHLPWPTFTPDAAAPGVSASPTTQANKVGVIAGHWQFDTGAVCPDGRREVDVTVDVAHRVEAILEARGLDAEVLQEHDPDVPQAPLAGYRAAALVSIHADSCNVPGASGFKVARWPFSSTPDADDRLVDCLYKEYAAATLMPRHDESITIQMRNYYAFREIGVDTPAAIIELGFLADDRILLDEHRYEMAMGVANGISCYLRSGAGQG